MRSACRRRRYRTASSGAITRIECGGSSISSVATVHARASSRREIRTNAMLTAAITPSPIPSRANRNGIFSHAAFCAIGCITHGKIAARPKYSPKNRKNPTHRKRHERLAEAIRRRAAPLCLGQVKRRGGDYRALRDAEKEQQIDQVGFPCRSRRRRAAARSPTRSRQARSSRPRRSASCVPATDSTACGSRLRDALR